MCSRSDECPKAEVIQGASSAERFFDIDIYIYGGFHFVLMLAAGQPGQQKKYLQISAQLLFWEVRAAVEENGSQHTFHLGAAQKSYGLRFGSSRRSF